MIFLRENESVQVFILVIYLFISIHFGDPMIPLTDLTPPHFCALPSYLDQEILIMMPLILYESHCFDFVLSI